MFEVDEKILLLGNDYPITDKLKIKQYKLNDILMNNGVMSKYNNAQSLFLTTPFNRVVELYDLGYYFFDVKRYDYFIQMCYSIIQLGDSEHNLNNIFEALFSDIKLNLEIKVENNIIFLIDVEQNIIINEDIYNNIRDVLKTMILQKDYGEDNIGLTTKSAIKAYAEMIKRKELYASLIPNKKKVVEKDLLKDMMNTVINNNNSINYSNIGNVTLFQLHNSYNKQREIIEFNSMLSGYYSNVVWDRAGLENAYKKI